MFSHKEDAQSRRYHVEIIMDSAYASELTRFSY